MRVPDGKVLYPLPPTLSVVTFPFLPFTVVQHNRGGRKCTKAPFAGFNTTREALMDQRRILRQPSAAEYLALKESTLEKFRTAGGGPRFILLGSRAIGYDIRDLDAWLEERKHTSTSSSGTGWTAARRSRVRAKKTQEPVGEVAPEALA